MPTTLQSDRARPGLATLEFVMCLPILVILFVTMVWISQFINGHLTTGIDARNDAFQHRYDPHTDAFKFRDNNLGEISGKGSTVVEMKSAVHAKEKASKRYAVLSGSWDHRAVNLNDQPNWKLYGQVAAESKLGKLFNLLGELKDMKDLAGKLAQKMIEGANPFKGKLDEITNLGGQLIEQAKEKKKEIEDKIQAEVEKVKGMIAEAEGKIKALENQITALKNKVNNIDQKLKDNEKAPEDKKLKPEEKKALEEERKDILEKQIPPKEKDLSAQKNQKDKAEQALGQANQPIPD